MYNPLTGEDSVGQKLLTNNFGLNFGGLFMKMFFNRIVSIEGGIHPTALSKEVGIPVLNCQEKSLAVPLPTPASQSDLHADT